MVQHVYISSKLICLLHDLKRLILCAHKHFHADINECSSNPCLNGGSCTDQVNGYVCACQAGYTGVECEAGKLKINK